MSSPCEPMRVFLIFIESSSSRKVHIALASGAVSQRLSSKSASTTAGRGSMFGALVRQIVTSLQHQRLNIRTWSNAGRPPFEPSEPGTARSRSAPGTGLLQFQRFQPIALGRQLLQRLVNVEKAELSRHCRSHAPNHRESAITGKRQRLLEASPDVPARRRYRARAQPRRWHAYYRRTVPQELAQAEPSRYP